MTTRGKTTTIIRLKSLKQSREDSDGLRILISRYGIRAKKKETWGMDEWWRELAPSKPLHRDWYDGKLGWKEYKERLIAEIRNRPEALNALRKLSSGYYDVVTLLCHCLDEKHCHRSIVKGMIQEITKTNEKASVA